jgi:hypothetical protein
MNLKSCIAMLAVLLAGSAARGADEIKKFGKLEEAVHDMAGEVAKFIIDRRDGGKAIRVSSFEGPNGSSSGANLVRILREQLSASSCPPSDNAPYKVSGKVSSMPDSGKMVTLIQAEIANSFNNTELTLQKRVITDATSTLAFLGTTADLSRAATGGTASAATSDPTKKTSAELALPSSEASDQLKQSVIDPQAAVVSETKQVTTPAGVTQDVVHHFVQVDPKSPYGLEVVKYGAKGGEYVPCEVTLEAVGEGGKIAYINLNPQDQFIVRIRNSSPRRVGCDLRLDGINVFAFSKFAPWKQLGKMVIGPGGGEVAGWHDLNDRSYQFTITSYANAPAGQLGVTEGVGTITAIFYEMHDQPLMGEAPVDAIGIGPEVKVPYKPAPAYFGNPVGTVTVRYRRSAPPPDLPQEALPKPAAPK